jgi:nicotinamide-nucleotide adenylyltransferase
MKKYRTGLLIGRFQPLHLGHIWLINHALQFVDSLIIGVGSVSIQDEDNPFSYEERKKMIEKIIEKDPAFAKATADEERIIKIVPLDDFYDDQLWFNNVIKLSGKIDVVVGNNEWTNKIFEKKGYHILRVGYYRRYIYEGERIRKLMKNPPSPRLPTSPRLRWTSRRARWEERVPKCLIDFLANTLKIPQKSQQSDGLDK